MNVEKSKEYWDAKFNSNLSAHSIQNGKITRDFILHAVQNNGPILSVLKSSKRVVEFGCGDGSMIKTLCHRFDWDEATGTDLSGVGVEKASDVKVKFCKHDCTKPFGESFDLVICSNVLEHFKNYLPVVSTMLESAPKLLLLVPYMCVVSSFVSEGGIEHVSQLNEDSFAGFVREDFFYFKTDGWLGDKQMAILISRAR